MFVTEAVIRYAWNKKGEGEKKAATDAVSGEAKKSTAIGKRAPADRRFIRLRRLLVGKFCLFV